MARNERAIFELALHEQYRKMILHCKCGEPLENEMEHDKRKCLNCQEAEVSHEIPS